MPLNILIVGAGIAGPSLAFFLQTAAPKVAYNITIIERSPSLRLAGQQVDFKSIGIPLLKKMRLLESVKALCVAENGANLVDTNDNVVARFGVIAAGEKRQSSLTNEYEIMRGDLVNMLYQETLKQRAKIDEEHGKETGSLKYEFGTSITDLAQDDQGVEVTLSSGEKRRYDLVVGADGQSSRTRRLAFGQAASDASFKSIGVQAAFYSIPRVEGEGSIAQIYFAPGKFVIKRNNERPMTQVYLFLMKAPESMKNLYREPVEKQKEVWLKEYKGAGWQLDRLLAGFDTCDDWYACEIGQIKMKSWSTGRVVLLGDAGYTPSPFTGMGTTLSLIGSYVLAGELTRNAHDAAGIAKTMKAYDTVLRVAVDECQQLPPTVVSIFPGSKLGVWIIQKTAWAIASLKLVERFQRWFPEDDKKGWKIPDYPELDLA